MLIWKLSMEYIIENYTIETGQLIAILPDICLERAAQNSTMNAILHLKWR